MLRYKRIFNLTTVLAIAVICLAPPTAADVCIWCNPVMSQTFLNCIYNQILYSPTFETISTDALDDMKNSMIAASQAITKSSDSTKMKMMNGAMAGEFAEIIKSQPPTGNPEKLTSDLMGIVGQCYVQTCGQPHYSFTQELGKTVDFMLNEPDEPSVDDAGSLTNFGPSQYPARAFASSAAFSGQNINNQPPNFNNAPRQQPPFAGLAANNFVPNQGNNLPLLNVLPEAIPSNQNTRPPNRGDASAVSLTYPLNKQVNVPYIRPDPIIQPQITNVNAASNSYSFQQNNRPNSAPNTADQQNSYVASSSAFSSTNQKRPFYNGPDQFLPQNNIPVNNAAPNYPINDQQNQPSFISVPPVQQTGSAATSGAGVLTLNDQSLPPYYPQNQFIPNPNLDGIVSQDQSSRAYPLNNAYSSPNQFDQSATGGNSVISYNEPQPNYVYDSDYPAPITSSASSTSSSSAVTQNKPSDATSQGNEYLSDNSQQNNAALLPKKRRKSKRPRSKNRIPPTKVKSGIVPNEEGSKLSENDDETAKAMRFAETLYVTLYRSDIFKDTFTEDISNDKAASCVYRIVVDALNDCGYSEFSIEIANVCIVAIKSLSENCPFVQYAETISKSLMSQFHMKKLIEENPEDQARSIAIALLSKLKQNKSSGSSSSASTSAASSSSSSSAASSSSSSSAISDSSATAAHKNVRRNKKLRKSQNSDNSILTKDLRYDAATKFYETLYVTLYRSNIFKYIFTEDISNDKAASCVYRIVVDALNDCGYSEFSIEIANVCIVAIKSLSENCPFVQYAETISKSLMSQFHMKKLIEENPEDQARSIAIALLSRLKQNKSSGSSSSASTSAASSSSSSSAVSDSAASSSSSSSAASSSSSSSAISDSSATAAHKNVRRNKKPRKSQNSDNSILTKDLRYDAATKFYETLYNGLLTSSDFNNVYNTEMSKSYAKSCAVALLISSLNIDYGNKLALEIAQECIRRISTVPNFSTTAVFAKIIAKCISDIFSNYNLILPDTPSEQASDISSKMINWLTQAINNGDVGQCGEPVPQDTTEDTDDGQDISPSLEIPDYPIYPAVPKHKVPRRPASSGTSVSNSRGSIDNSYPNYDDYPNYAYSYYDNSNPKLGSPSDVRNDYNYPYYEDTLIAQINKKPNQHLPGKQTYSTKDDSPDYYKTPGPTEIQNDGSDDDGQHTDATSSAFKKKNQKRKNRRRKIKSKVDKSVASANSNAVSSTLDEDNDNFQTNPDDQTTLVTYDTQTVQPQQDKFLDSPSNEDGGNSYPSTILTSLQAQTISDDEKVAVKDRVQILMKWTLESMSDGNFNYKLFSRVISALAKYVQRTHPEWGSQKCLLKILTEAIIACTQLLIQAPPGYFDDKNILKNADVTNAAVASWSTDSSSEQDNQSLTQRNENDVPQVDQDNERSEIFPQQDNWSSNYHAERRNSLPLNTKQEGYRFDDLAPEPNINAPPMRQKSWITNVPQPEERSLQPNTQTSSQGSDNSALETSGGYTNQNFVPFNRQRNWSLSQTGGLNPNLLQQRNQQNQRSVLSGNPYQTTFSQGNDMLLQGNQRGVESGWQQRNQGLILPGITNQN